MGRFVIKLLVCAALIAVAVVSVCMGVYLPTDGLWTKDSYQKGFVYQIRALESSATNSPKVLVLGGSYMTFGMDMPLFRQQMDMPSYALGVHSGMGQSYVFEIAKEFVGAGDIVIFVFEGFRRDYYGMPLIYQALDGEDDLMVKFCKAHPKVVAESFCKECSRRLLNVLSEKSLALIRCVRAMMSHCQVANKEKDESPPAVYCARSFDPRTGDLVLYRLCEYEKGQRKARVRFDVNAINASCFDVVNDFHRACRLRGADMVIAFAPVCDDYLLAPVADLDKYSAELQAKLLPKIIGRRKASIYPVEMMHGHPLHLNSCGARCYTEQLVKDVKAYLGALKP